RGERLKRETHVKEKATPARGAQGRRRIKQVFAFLKAFAERRAPNVRTLDEVPRKLRLKLLPEHPSIKIGAVTLRPAATRTRDEASDEEDARTAEPLIRVRRPALTKAPPPPDSVAEWVLRGWDRPDGKIAVLELRNKRGRDGKI